MTYTFIYPMAAHVVLTAFLYGLLTVARAPAVWGVGRASDGSNPWADTERRISANLSNQFEWPLFFHVACLIWLHLGPDSIAVTLAWIFIAGRILHSLVQVLTRNVRLRGVVFTVNFLAVLWMWAMLLLRVADA
jgi:hypothetical protein